MLARTFRRFHFPNLTFGVFLGSLLASHVLPALAQDKKTPPAEKKAATSKETKGLNLNSNDSQVIALVGKLEDWQGNVVKVKDNKGATKMVALPVQPSDIRFRGEAELEWLQAGMMIRFVAEMNGTGQTKMPVHEIEVFSPQLNPRVLRLPEEVMKNTPGIYPVVSSKDGGPAKEGKDKPSAASPGSNEYMKYTVVGNVIGMQNNLLSVKCGTRPVQVTLQEKAKVKVSFNGLELAKVGDKVEASGLTSSVAPDNIVAEQLTVTAAKPLGNESAKLATSSGKKSKGKGKADPKSQDGKSTAKPPKDK